MFVDLFIYLFIYLQKQQENRFLTEKKTHFDPLRNHMAAVGSAAKTLPGEKKKKKMWD